MENNYIVYMHISPNNKRYIGLTCQKPEYRWNNGKGYKHNEYFTRAIEKYGWNNFQHIIIAKGLTEDEAKWLEIELIREWDSMNRDKGYNLTKGGEGANGLICSEETRKKISEANRGENNPVAKKVILLNTKEIFPTITLGAEKYNVGNTSISNCCNEELKSAGKLDDGTPLVWMYYDEYLNITEEEIQEKLNKKDIRVILLNTKEIFPTMKQCVEKYDISYSNISQCCSGKIKSTGKLNDGTPLVWMYYRDYLMLSEGEIQDKLKKADIRIICITTNEIFQSAKEGGEKYNIYNSNIIDCCQNEIKKAGKLDDGTPLVWMYYRDYLNITEEEKRNKMKEADSRVILLNTNEIFSSITEGAKEYNINQGNISQCCNKKLKSAGKHPVTGEKLIWMFYSEYNKNI